jgi:hypothetical protein
MKVFGLQSKHMPGSSLDLSQQVWNTGTKAKQTLKAYSNHAGISPGPALEPLSDGAKLSTFGRVKVSLPSRLNVEASTWSDGYFD